VFHLEEAAKPINSRGGEFRKHPFISRIDPRHAPS
jgi:hypothetical protein